MTVTTMECPVCSYRLRRAKAKNVVVDICTHCSGIWFDSGELQIFLRDLVKSDKINPQKTSLFQSRDILTTDQSVAESRMCPKCGLVMKTFNYAYDSNVFVDKCPRCEGIWTDGGEVKQLARLLKEDPRARMIAQDMLQRHKAVEELRDWGNLSDTLMQSVPLHVLFMPKIIVPLGDDTEREKFPLITLLIIILCIAGFLFEVFGVRDIQVFINRFGFVPQHFWSIGLITSMFLHGGIFHLVGNMFFLWVFGDNVEERFGYLKYSFFYLGAGIAASLLYALTNIGSTIPAIGASGAISGIMGAYCVLFPKARLKLFIICHVVRIPAYLFLTIWFLLQLMYGALSLSYDTTYGVAWFAHIGGFVFGVTTAYFIKKVSSELKD